MRRFVGILFNFVLGLVLALALAPTPSAYAEDSDTLRGYLHLKFRDTSELTGVYDSYGFALGANINRYFALELSGDRFELRPKVAGIGTVSEYGVFALMPQVRLRYPLFGNRIVPYVLGGAGVAFTEINDRKPPAFGLALRSESSTPTATLGAGVDWFLADSIAFTAEFKYLFAETQTLKVGGVSHQLDISAPLASVGFRFLVPESTPTPPAALREPAPLRLYFTGRFGLVQPFDTDLGAGIEMRPVPSAIGGELGKYFGLGFGLDVGKHLGVELGVGGYEVSLALQNLGTVIEYAFYEFMPRLRVRQPLDDGRWVLYGLAGVGLGYTEANDRKPRGNGLRISAQSNSVAAAIGAGFDYFVAPSVAFGFEGKYLYSPGHHITIAGRSTDIAVQAFALTFGLRAYLADFGSR